MTKIDDIIINNPEILLYLDDLNRHAELIKAAWLNTFWTKLEYKLQGDFTPTIDASKKDTVLLFVGKSDSFMKDQIRFSFFVQWFCKPPYSLRVAIKLSNIKLNDDISNINEIYKHYADFSCLKEKVKSNFTSYTGENQSACIPTSLTLINNFMDNNFLAENLNIWDDRHFGDELINKLYEEIKKFVEVVNAGIIEIRNDQKQEINRE